MTLEKFVAIVSALDAQTVMLITAVTAIASIFIAGCALAATIWQGCRGHKHNKLSVKPHLTSKMEHSTNNIIKNGQEIEIKCCEFTIINSGIGPAEITDITVFFNEDPILYNTHEDYKKALRGIVLSASTEDTTALTFHSISCGSMVAIGEEKTMWKLEYNPKTENPEVSNNFEKLAMLIEYQSIYKDKMPPVDIREKT